MMEWPSSAEELDAAQRELAALSPPAWHGHGELTGACFVCFPRNLVGPGTAGDPAHAAAVLTRRRKVVAERVVAGSAGARYRPGLLALREGPLLEAAVRSLPRAPDVLLVNATGRDHPRRAGLALHLGAVLDVPTVGVTDRLLIATGDVPGDARAATAPVVLDGDVVGFWVRSRAGTKPIAVHAAWRTDADVAVATVMAALRRARTPEPLRRARRIARLARAGRYSPVL
jgi:deoxyribonuclease V